MPNNFGWRSRDMVKAAGFALKSAVEQKTLSFSSAATIRARFEQAAAFFKEEGIKYLEFIDRDAVLSYAEHLKERVAEGDMSIATAHNYISAINTVMDICTRGEWETVTAVRDCGFDSRSLIRTEVPPTREEAREVAERVADRAGEVGGMLVRFATEFGLRAREASLLRPGEALERAERTGSIRIEKGTKGGRAREVPVERQEQWLVLREAASSWGDKNALEVSGHDNWRSYHDTTLREVREAVREEGRCLHDFRATYACSRYEELTSSAPPAWGGEVWRGADEDALQQLSEELGHGRVDVLVSYLGPGR